MAGTPGAIPAVPVSAAYLGQGIAYPPSIDTAGRLAIANGAPLVSQALQAILQTQPGERAMQPDFGGDVGVFEPIGNAGRIQARLMEQIQQHEPRVASVDVRVEAQPSQGEQQVTIQYSLIGSTNSQELVYPFFQPPALI